MDIHIYDIVGPPVPGNIHNDDNVGLCVHVAVHLSGSVKSGAVC